MAGTFGLALAGSATIALAVGFAASRASAQTAGTAHHHDAAPSAKAGSHKHSDNEAAADPSRAVDETMSGAMTANPHMRMSPMRVASRADSARAAQLVNAFSHSGKADSQFGSIAPQLPQNMLRHSSTVVGNFHTNFFRIHFHLDLGSLCL